MSIVVVTGSAGLVGSEAVRFFSRLGFDVLGIDNDMRMLFFGPDASTRWNRKVIEKECPRYTHFDIDIRDEEAISKLFKDHAKDIVLVVHTAAQPSHDFAASRPSWDFTVNANGTLNLLENFRKYTPDAVFIFTSTNKVYGDLPNSLELVEQETRYDLPETHKWYNGIDETMSIDQCLHSLFGVSKIASDLLVQEYGRYFGFKTAIFRGGCLTGPSHSGTKLHGFLSYLMKCAVNQDKYHIYGYNGKQVRDNIHSHDLINAFYCFFKNPKPAQVYNMGGGRTSNISMMEAIELCGEISGKKLAYEYVDQNRTGDHIWWISGLGKFKSHFPEWEQKYGVKDILTEIYEAQNNKLIVDVSCESDDIAV